VKVQRHELKGYDPEDFTQVTIVSGPHSGAKVWVFSDLIEEKRTSERPSSKDKVDGQQKEKQKAGKQQIKGTEQRAAEPAKPESEKQERDARYLLRLGNSFRDEANRALGQRKLDLLEKAQSYYRDVLKKYPDSKAAVEAKKVLKELNGSGN
jgi:hypothetical protein